MKRALLILSLCVLGVSVGMAQATPTDTAVKKHPHKFYDHLGSDGIYLRDSTWKIGGFIGFNVSQTALYQWGPGGTNSFSFMASASLFANYKKGNWEWSNNLDIKYGMVANGLIRSAALAERNFQKNIDVLQFSTSAGYKVSKALYVSAKIGFLSQFSRTYDYSQTDTSLGRFRRYTISKFGAPAVLTIGPGLTWKPKDYFTLFFSPVEGKMTFVTPDDPGKDTALAADGTYSNRYYTDIDETRFGLKRGTSFMGELGAELDILFQKDIVKNVNWKTHLNVFFSYSNSDYNTLVPYYYSGSDSMGLQTISKSTSHIPVIHWDNDFVFKINKILSATLSTRFVYQYNAQTPVDNKNNATGAKGPDGLADVDKNGNPILTFNKLQIFEQFGIGLAVKF